jgi:glycosyltransferase involved in cell wall biosynthesis
MIKIIWLCNVVFSEDKIVGNGSWLQPLAAQLQLSKKVQKFNITIGSVAQVTKQDYDGITQWIIPERKSKSNGQIASFESCTEVALLVKEVNPDLVHIWGTESIWASIYEQEFIKVKTIIDIQGLLSVYKDYYFGGLNFNEILQSINLKEILMPWRILFEKKRVFEKRGQVEKSCLKIFQNISVQSNWVKCHVSIINPEANYFHTKIMLRDSFYNASTWEYKIPSDNPLIFSSCSAAVSYKGLHVLIKAISVLKIKYPNIQLNLAGNINVGNRLQDGYSLFLNMLIKRYDLTDNVQFLGSLNEYQIIDHLNLSNVCVVPSFIETYCLAFAEAMMIGIPSVVSYAGAMPELAIDKEEALFYNSIDFGYCAYLIDKLIQNQELAESISKKSRKRRLLENGRNEVLKKQLEIYDSLLDEN